jgi:hypothetical protein
MPTQAEGTSPRACGGAGLTVACVETSPSMRLPPKMSAWFVSGHDCTCKSQAPVCEPEVGGPAA